MKVFKVGLKETGFFNNLFNDYLNGESALNEFYDLRPDLNSFRAKIENRTFPDIHREILVSELEEQYKDLKISPLVAQNIKCLSKKDSYTVTTGHQLNLATGPLFFIYKILSTIKLAERLRTEFPDKNFVPVYWMASEDHDFEEINHFKLFGKTYKWETEQKGAVGRFSTIGLKNILEQLPEKFDELINAYKPDISLAQATRNLVNEMFGDMGLVIIDPDSKKLKGLFSKVFKAEISESLVGNAVKKTTDKLNSLGYKTQVFPREVNLFLLNKDRVRIDKEGNKCLCGEESISTDLLCKMVDSNPEMFSPNVVLRPLYQEYILPNLAYFGGSAEVAYWLQLKSAFDLANISYPILLPRNFFLYVDTNTAGKLDKLKLNPVSLLQPEHVIKENFVKENTQNEISISEQVRKVEAVFSEIKEKAQTVDKSLEGFVAAEWQKTNKDLQNIEKKLKKAEEQKFETSLKQISSVLAKLFPSGSLQERSENYFSFFANDKSFLEKIKTTTDPLDFTFKILIDQE